MDILEFAEHLRHPVGIRPKLAQRKVGRALSTGLPCVRDLELRAAGIASAIVLPLYPIAPSLDEESLNEGSFTGGFLQDLP